MSQLDDLLVRLPRKTTALVVIIVGIAFAVLSNPLHSICDTEKETVLEDLRGYLSSGVSKKTRLPPLLGRSRSICQAGYSSGACYEYFNVLKKLVREVGKASTECQSEIAETPDLKAAFDQGIELMALMAWGDVAPEATASRFGWYTESELVLFCKLKDAYLLTLGEEAWLELRSKVYGKFPLVTKVNDTTDQLTKKTIEAPKAALTMSSTEIYSRSIFSAPCAQFKSLSLGL